MNIVKIRSVIFLLVIVVVLLVCCISCDNVTKKETTDQSNSAINNSNIYVTNNESSVLNSEDLMKNVIVSEVDKYAKDYGKIEFPIEFDADVLSLINPIDTDEEAKIVAIDILEERHKQRKWLDYTLVGILHSTEDNVWRFEYSLDQSDVPVDELVDCSCVYVVVDGNSGELIAAWAEE